MTSLVHPARRLDEGFLDDVEEVLQTAALDAFENMRARGHSREAAWSVADQIVSAFLRQMEAADAS